MTFPLGRLRTASGVFALAAIVAATLAGACRGKDASAAPVATATVTLNHDKAAIGSPLELTYKFVVASDARFDQDYWVMLHVLDSDDQLIWTDDHNPPMPTSQWKPGQTVEYTRTLFIPVYPYVGDASLQLGLYSRTTQKRLVLTGQDVGQHAYKVGRLLLQPQTESIVTVTKDGWNPTEVAEHNASVTWNWTKKQATLAFKNPKQDSVLYLDVDNPGGVFEEPQQVKVTLGSETLDDFQVTPKKELLRKIAIKTAQLGTADMAEVRITVDKTFVPAVATNGASKDPRELGVRVFHAFIQTVK